jgi:hypothetical protein|tara:strand:+ start:394 stop:567 length:174 start_codon:yes stop_codon:yes gene_type:complete
MQEEAKVAVDALAVTTTVSTLMGWLPAVAAALSIVWTVVRIFETNTIQNLIHRKKDS